MNTLRSITRCVLLGLGIAALPAILSAQPVSNFTSVLQRIPQPPAVPTDAELLSKPPEYFETSSDLNSIAQEIDGYVNKLEARATLPAGGAMTGPGESAPTEMASNSTPESGTPTKGNIGNATVQSVPTTTITPIDTVLRLAHAIDLISRAVERSYINSDNIYSDKVNTANEHMRALQMKEPCGSDTKCFKRHRRAYDLELAEAEKSRITAASSIITSEVTELLGTMRSLDELLPKTLMTVRDIEFRKALSETIIIASNILTDITEHIKISRIGISNCAKLLREANDY